MSLKNETILIVEDELVVADLLTYVVESEGGTVVGPATSTETARRLIATEAITAAVLDLNILDGVTTPVAISLAERAIPFILFTADSRDLDQGAMAGVPLLRKPALPTRIVQTLVATIAASRADPAGSCTARRG